MRLLVSVRNADEAAAAVTGGADIVDAKEPALGPLAPVAPGTLQAICRAVPLMVPLSVALGDVAADGLASAVSAVAPMRPRHALYFKAALVSSSPRAAAGGIAHAAQLMRSRADQPEFIVARYVDAASDAADVAEWIDVCVEAGARGLLLDTSRKGQGNLLTSIDARALESLRRRAAQQGIWLALAGGMTIDDVEVLASIRPHVVGVRGAVCDGGRAGALSPVRMKQLREALDGVNSAAEQASPV